MNRRICITGAGVVSAIGNNQQQTLQALINGTSGIAPVAFLPTEHREFPVGEVKMSNEEMCRMLHIPLDDGGTLRRHSRTELMGIIAVREALEEAQLSVSDIAPSSVALISGTTVGGMDLTEQFYPDRLDRELLLNHACGAVTDRIADYFGCFDFVTTPSTACSSALNAIIFGARLIECGMREIAVVGGSECLTRFHLNGFKSLMILDTERCRPFDASRNGLNLGEGAAYLVIESEASAQRRGVTPIGEIRGTGNACDAYHQTASSEQGDGAFLAMQQALHEAGLSPDEIQYVNAHGTGTPNNDASESQALRRIFGNRMPLVSSTKSFTGHTTSASGSIEAVFCLLALQHQFVPRNLGWQQADSDCIIPYTAQRESRIPLSRILCNAFGFGGNDSSLILSEYEAS